MIDRKSHYGDSVDLAVGKFLNAKYKGKSVLYHGTRHVSLHPLLTGSMPSGPLGPLPRHLKNNVKRGRAAGTFSIVIGPIGEQRSLRPLSQMEQRATPSQT